MIAAVARTGLPFAQNVKCPLWPRMLPLRLWQESAMSTRSRNLLSVGLGGWFQLIAATHSANGESRTVLLAPLLLTSFGEPPLGLRKPDKFFRLREDLAQFSVRKAGPSQHRRMRIRPKSRNTNAGDGGPKHGHIAREP